MTRLLIELSTISFFTLLWCAIVAFLRVKKNKRPVYLLFFTIFYIYLYKVLDYTLIQFQSLLLLRHFMPDLMLQGITGENILNLVPLITLTPGHLRTSLLNILLMVPFGFGLPFIRNYRMRKVVVLGALFSIAIELLQLTTGLIAQVTFRIADINDVIFNTLGVALGYALFAGFAPVVRPALARAQ